MTTIYFDTNVYRMATARSEVQALKSLLCACHAKVVASETNLFETYAISSYEVRQRETRTLVALVNRFPEKPTSWLQADEVRRQIQAHRPDWLKRSMLQGKIKTYLRNHKQNWQLALQGRLPLPHEYDAYKQDSESGTARAKEAQKGFRKARLDEIHSSHLALRGPSGEQLIAADVSDPEVFWRLDNFTAWDGALLRKLPSSRDYYDWLAPAVRIESISAFEFANFWLSDVSASAVPRNRLSGLITFHQLDYKITHGNNADSFHASHALDVDHFFTGDEAFCSCLQKALSTFPRRAAVHFIERGAESLCEQVRVVLR
ncbi:MAG TPA: hypothetical protein VJM31_08985 [Vicinamibacterales bacterium]|nr:hypothetical protein [Vicinamibacterales bacterium]